MHRTDSPRPVSDRESGTPPAIDALVRRMLDKRAGRRPTMAQLVREINDLLLSLGPLPLPRRLRMRARRFLYTRGIGLALAALMLPILFIAIVFLKIFWFPPMVRFDAGQFKMGSDARQLETVRRLVEQCTAGNPKCSFYLDRGLLDRETPVREIHLAPFELDRYEVTNADFSAWLQGLWQKGQTAPEEHHWIIDKQRGHRLVQLDENYAFGGILREANRIVPRRGMEQRPAVAVTWYGAEQYCRDHDKRLPTEAEWEYAATSQGRHPFPFGDGGFDCDKAVVERGKEYNACAKVIPPLPDVGALKADVTDQGVHDLAGSVSEWVADYFRPTYQPCSGVCESPVVSTPASDRSEDDDHVIRGGAWSLDFVSTHAAGRSHQASEKVVGSTGFRCARSAK